MAELSDKDREAVESAICAGNKIEAIKLYRKAVPGSGLADAKKWVEEREAELRLQHPEKFTAAPKKVGCFGMLVVVMLVLVTVVALKILALRS